MSETQPLVSVIIACYNQAQFLAESIESARRQTCQDREIIVIDDGSTDHPEAVARAYSDIDFVRQNNQGASAARNAGWRRSHGEFLVFLDADDRLLPDALAVSLRCFREHPDCGFVFGHGALIDSKGDRQPDAWPTVIGPASYEQFLEQNLITFPGLVMVRRTAFEEVEGFVSVVNGTFIGNASDYDLYLRLASRHPVFCHGGLTAEWRKHGTNTSSGSLMMLQTVLAVLGGQEELVRQNPRYVAARKKGLRRVRHHYSEELIDELRAESRAGRIHWRKFTRSVLALLWHAPQTVFASALKKATHVLLGASRGE
jgi:hypothetical protein